MHAPDRFLRRRMDPNRPVYKPEFWEKVQYLDDNQIAEDPYFHCNPLGVGRQSVLSGAQQGPFRPPVGEPEGVNPAVGVRAPRDRDEVPLAGLVGFRRAGEFFAFWRVVARRADGKSQRSSRC